MSKSSLHIQDVKIAIQKSDLNDLRQYLTKQGIDHSDLEILTQAIDEDDKPTKPNEYGKTVSNWIGNMLSKAASGAWKITLEAGATVLTNAINKYYGL